MNARRIPELDGVRGVAILLVVYAHAVQGLGGRALAPWMESKGGLVGVHLFFVLSGYLITSILLAERGRTGTLDLLAFYKRRLSRLYPSLLVVALFVAFVDPWSALRALTYSSNWLGGEHGRGILAHSWSLSVEEQFYLAWPALLLLSGRWASVVCVAGIALTMTAQVEAGWSERAVYYGLRWDAILAGCLVALMGFRASRAYFYAGLAVLAFLTLGTEMQTWLYPLSTVACVGIVAGAKEARWLAVPWLVHVGRLSYALYLWHGVVMRTDLPVWLTVALSFALAEATWLLVDRKAQVRRTPSRQPAVFHVKQEA